MKLSPSHCVWLWFPFRRLRLEGLSVRWLCWLGLGVSVLTAWGLAFGETVVVINELDADQTGDDTAEFIELYAYDSETGQPVANFDLSAYTLVFFNGANERAYRKIELVGRKTSSTGFYVIGNEGVPFADPELWLPLNSLQNGGASAEGDAVALVKGDVSGLITSGENAMTLPDFPAGVELVDAVVYDGGIVPNGDDVGLLEGLNLAGQHLLHDPLDASLARQPDGGEPFNLSAFIALRPPTPGLPNVALPVLSVAINPVSFPENAGPNAAVVTVTRSEPLTEALTVTLRSSDESEAVLATATVVIPAGEAQATIALHAMDDEEADGTQTVTITASAPGYQEGFATVTVTDNDQAPVADVVYINEIDTDQPGADTGEFIELFVGEPAVRTLDGYVVVLFNGANNQSYRTLDLTGKTTNAHGLFVIGNASVAQVGLVIPDGTLQNGTDAVAVYRAAASRFSNGSAPSEEDLVDVVVYGDELENPLLTSFREEALTLYSEGAANNPDALARVPDATTPFGPFVVQAPTPGAPNAGPAPADSYAQWASAYPGLGSPLDDDDGDGLSNLVEYALGSHPRQPGVPYTIFLNEQGKPVLRAPKGELAAADTRLSYIVEASTTLEVDSWSAADVVLESHTVEELRAVYQGEAPAVFFRLRVMRSE